MRPVGAPQHIVYVACTYFVEAWRVPENILLVRAAWRVPKHVFYNASGALR